MAAKAKQKRYKIAGAVPEDESWLDPLWARLQAEPRDRQWVIAEVVNADSGVEHPDDEPDNPHMVLSLRSVYGVADEAACKVLDGLAAEIRDARPGQSQFSYEGRA